MFLAVASAALFAHAASTEVFVVHAGQTVVYDTSQGPLLVAGLRVEAGGLLRVIGPEPFVAIVRGTAKIDGTVDLSGFDAHDVATLDTGNVPEPGGDGGPGGGRGGVSSFVTTASTPVGGVGFGALQLPSAGGGGGESSYAPGELGTEARRPGGGGGGALGPDQPAVPTPGDPANQGLVAVGGADGFPVGRGALTDLAPSAGGARGPDLFPDGDPTNDFWGIGFDRDTRRLVQGELAAPAGGSGGGAGGDAVPAASFPHPSWSPASDEKGGPGGGGGGLGIVLARALVIGPEGAVRADGGRGARGENVLFLDHVGASGGGGSGGTLVLQAELIDLRAASARALTALGGAGGEGHDPGTGAPVSRGGNGGAGVIQLHTPFGARVLLPDGATLGELTSPRAHRLFLDASAARGLGRAPAAPARAQ
jgi:hypothetical protein